MGIIRPATPGFIVTLVATGLLAAVSFCVPWIQSVYFLEASFTSNGVSGSITFGTLGYCLHLDNGTTCSKPSIGYELDINGLVGNRLPIQIPQVAVKWLTYCLFLHVVALILAAGSSVFGLLAHVREMAMTCFSTCISGFAAVVALLAFIFDIAFFFLAKTRINAVHGGSATIGNAIWLTLISWVLLFFSGCFYTFGRCCISSRGPSNRRWNKPEPEPGIGPSNGYAEQLRLDAVKAEADRKARQEIGLPAFSESAPLKARIEGDEVFLDDEESHSSSYDNPNVGSSAAAAAGYGRRPSQNSGYRNEYPAGYVQGPPGGRTVDDYYAGGRPPKSLYPPRQPSMASSVSNYSTPSGYAPSNPTAATSLSQAPSNQYLSPYTQYNQQPRYADPSPQNYGHTASGTSYHSALTHQQYPSQYDSYDVPPRAPTAFNPDTYNSTGLTYSPQQAYEPSPYLSPSQQQQPDRSYTLGGDGYGSNPFPPLQENDSNQSSFFMYPGDTRAGITASPAPISTNLPAPRSSNTSPVKGPRSPRSPTFAYDDDNPPEYDAGSSQPPGAWGEKR